jgi:hypothetical protein
MMQGGADAGGPYREALSMICRQERCRSHHTPNANCATTLPDFPCFVVCLFVCLFSLNSIQTRGQGHHGWRWRTNGADAQRALQVRSVRVDRRLRAFFCLQLCFVSLIRFFPTFARFFWLMFDRLVLQRGRGARRRNAAPGPARRYASKQHNSAIVATHKAQSVISNIVVCVSIVDEYECVVSMR